MKSQMEMPFFGMTRKPRRLTEDEYEYLRTQPEPEQAAIVLMIEHGAYKHRQYMLAYDLGFSERSGKVQLSQIKSGQKNLRTSKIKHMEALTGVSALTDYWKREEFGAMYPAVVGLLEAGAAVTKAHSEQLRAAS